METSASQRTKDAAAMPKDPFRTLAREYVPSNIKTAFRRALLIYKSDILITRMVKKLAEYPITPVQYKLKTRLDDESNDKADELELKNNEYEEIYRKIFERGIGIQRALIEIGHDYFLYQNAFPHITLPIERQFACRKCAAKLKPGAEETWYASEQILELTWDGKEFSGKCPICKGPQKMKVREEDIRNGYDRVSFTMRNLFNIKIEQSEITGRKRYTYSVSNETKSKIKKNDRFTLDNTPLTFLRQAYKPGTEVELDARMTYHFRAPGPSMEDNSPWAWPLLVAAIQTILYVQHLKKASEAIAAEHIHPKVWIAPAVPVDLLASKFDFENISTKMKEAYENSRSDETNPVVFPFPSQTGLLNLNGRMFLPATEIRQGMEDVFIGMGMPRGLLSGEGPYQAGSIAIRVIENGFLTYRTFVDELLDFWGDLVASFFNLPPCQITLQEFVKLDDALHKQALASGVAQKIVSRETYLKSLNLNPKVEADKIEQETMRETELQVKAEALLEQKRSEIGYQLEIDNAARSTEAFINESEKRLSHMVSLVENLVRKGYTKEFATGYVSQFMAQETARMQKEAERAKFEAAQEAFFRDRLASATHSLNKAESKQQMTGVMSDYLNNPGSSVPQEQQSLGGLVQRLMIMKDDERNRSLDELQRSQPETWAQVVNILAVMGHGNAQVQT